MRQFTLLAAFAALAWGSSPEVDRARKLYSATNFEESLKVLQSIQQKDGAVYALIGRNWYMSGEFKKATEALEKALAAEPFNAEHALWLARAYGRRAETSNPITAPGYASKARRYFELSTQLNPRSLEALTDLFEYYLEAPGFLGGGLDKAQATAARIGAIDAGEGHWSQARLAEKRKEFGSAEEQLRRAIEASPQQIGRFIDLARFLTKQGRFQESDQSLARAESINPNSPKLLYAKADLYIKQGRNLNVARDILRRYLSMSLTPEDPPRSDAEKLLRQARGS